MLIEIWESFFIVSGNYEPFRVDFGATLVDGVDRLYFTALKAIILFTISEFLDINWSCVFDYVPINPKLL